MGIELAGKALGMGLSKARQLARDGEFPTPVERWGNTYVVFRSHILRVLGIHDAYAAEPPEQEAARLSETASAA